MIMITEKHKKFVSEIIKLARKHKMGNLHAEFGLSFNNADKMGIYDHDKVKVDWSEGRHGAKHIIHMQSTEHVHIDE